MPRIVPSALAIVLLILAARTSPADEGVSRFEFREPHMGTEFNIVIYSKDQATARRASRAAFDRIAELNAKLSDYDPESELMLLCAGAGGPPVRVSEDLFRVLERSMELAERTGGAFDPTINPVGRLWRRARRDRRLPDPQALARALALVDYRNIVLDPETRMVRLLRPGVKLDLGGIAKGFAADEALKVLKAQGISRALIAAAGDIAVSEPPPGTESWTIAVAPLRNVDANGPSPALRLANRAVSTSGDAEQFVEIDGIRYSHIVDPRTGLGVVGRSSATVVASDATTSDSLATALSVLGPEKGMALIESTPGAAALFVRATEHGMQVIVSNRWDEIPRAEADPAAP